jgi:hypothetical protein
LSAGGRNRDDIKEMVLVDKAGRLWMSHCTLQGFGSDPTLAIDGFASMHVECSIPHLFALFQRLFFYLLWLFLFCMHSVRLPV